MLNNIDTFLAYLSGCTFIFYGLAILLTTHMVNEFIRYKMIKFRILTGYLELLGGLSLITGVYVRELGISASLGLSILMLMGSIVRIKIKDPFLETVPALVLMALNFYLFLKFIG